MRPCIPAGMDQVIAWAGFLGAALLAAEQTWQVIDRHGWPGWLFWPVIIVMLAASVLNTALRMIHDQRTAAADEQVSS